MKSKIFTALVFSIILILGACGNEDNAANEREEVADELNPNNEMRQPADPELNERLGYVRYTQDEIDNNEENQQMTMDRPQIADMITRTILQNKGFEEVATLVTDKEVLIAYEKNGDLDKEAAAGIASKSAESVMPRYFDIHVSDKAVLIDDIQSLHNSSTENRNYDNTINQIIQEMNDTSND
ncbi:YhcN/YlaJ family sporulation lipoprotein [Virgibacillus ainsalahensis]